MKKTHGTARFIYMLLSALPLMAMPAVTRAQYQVGSDGRALDANNRLDSGGDNGPGRLPNQQVTGNEVVTGNVTAGREFRGFVPYRDPKAFTDIAAGQTADRFIAGSTGSSQSNTAPGNINTPRPFYGQSRFAPPPPGFVRDSTTGAYVPAPNKSAQYEDTRVGALPDPSITALPLPGELMMPGPVNPASNQRSIITASPLYGVRQLQPTQPGDADFLANYTSLRQGSLNANRLRIDETRIQQMQSELLKPAAEDLGALQQLSRPPEAPGNTPLSSQAIQSDQVPPAALGGDASMAEGTRQRMVLAPPTEQSTQYADLTRRLDQLNRQTPAKMTDEEANRLYRAKLRAIEQYKTSETPKPAVSAPQPLPGQANQSRAEKLGLPDYGKQALEQVKNLPPGRAVANATTAPANLPPVIKTEPDAVKPLQIHSLAEGVKAPGLGQLLARAESLMKEGKFTSALDQYDVAERVAPNNKLIVLGRAVAELGAGYYARAEADLYDAFLNSEALLMGQYDLKSWFGEQRLAYLVRDLKDVAKSETSQGRPLLLLAFIAYNTGNERLAPGYLDLCEKRSAGPNPLLPLLRKHWALPTLPTPDGNNPNE